MTRGRTGRTWTKFLVYSLLCLLAFQLASHFWTDSSEGGACGAGRGMQSSAVVCADWCTVVEGIHVYGESIGRNLSLGSSRGRSLLQWRKDKRMMKAKKKRLLETCHWLVEKSRGYWSFAAMPAAAAASEVLLLFGIDDPKAQKQEEDGRSEIQEKVEDLIKTLAQIHRDDDARLETLCPEDGIENLPQKVLKIQQDITKTLSEEATSLEPTEWFDRMEKRVKHLADCKLVTSKGSCTEPCCMLSQLQQEFKAEWPMVVQMLHQAYAKAVNDHAANLENADREWHRVLRRLETEVQSYETTQNRQSVVTSETLEALKDNDPGVLMDQKWFGTDLPDTNLMRLNASLCRKGCQAARSILLEARSSLPKVDPNAKTVTFRHRSALALSELKRALKGSSPKLVTVVCPGIVYVDCDMCLPGTSVAVQAGCVEVRESCTLNLDGAAAAEPQGKPSKAKNATEKGNHEMHGDTGIGGKDGAPGGSGGHFYCHARISAVGDAKWTVHGAGAKGGKGQDGGDGGNGRAAKKGTDASIPDRLPGWCCSCCKWPPAYAIFRYGKPATPGGNAGAKGPGGKGGEGGYHGKSDVKAFGACSSAVSVQSSSGRAEDGPAGKPGTCGIPGQGAAHGKHKGIIKKANQSEESKEGVELRMKVDGTVVKQDYHRNLSIRKFIRGIKTSALWWEDDCREKFDFAEGVPTNSVQGTVPQTIDVQSKHRRTAVDAAGVPKQQLQNDLVAEVQERLKTWPSNEIVSLAQELISAYGGKANLPGEVSAQGSRAEALKQAVNSCKEQIQERHCEQVQQVLVAADYRNDRREAILAEDPPIEASEAQVPWRDEWPKRCCDFGSLVWEQIIVTSDRPSLQMVVDGFHFSPSMSNLVKVAKALEKDDEEVPQVVANLQLAAVADLFPANDAGQLLQSTVDAVRNEAAEVAYRFRTENEQEMMRCLMALETERPSKADLLKLESETLSDKALDARRRIGIEGCCGRDLLSLKGLMTFAEGRTFTDMHKAGGLLLQLVPLLSPQEPLGPWHENYRLFRQSGGVFEPKAVVTCVEHILSLPQLPHETLQVVLVDLMCEVLQLTATQMKRLDPLWAMSLKLIAEKPQVLGPVAQCLQLLLSCQKGENIAQIWQTREDGVATVDEDVRMVHREVALASQEMCCQPEDCSAILKNRHQKAMGYLREALRNDEVVSEVASSYVSALFKLRMAAEEALRGSLVEDPLEDELQSARAKLNEARYGVNVAEPAWRIRVGRPQQRALPLRHETCRGGGGCTFECDCGKGCQCPSFKATEKCRAEFPPLDAFVDAGWSLTTVKIKTADSERTCALQGATFHVLPSETPKYFRFGIDVETRSVDCRLEAMGQDEEWIEVWKGKTEVAGKQSPWISFPTVPFGQKTLQFRYVKLGDTNAGAVQKLEGRTSLLRLRTAGVLVNKNIFDFEELCQVTALRIFMTRTDAQRPLLPSVVEVSSDGEHWCTLEVDQGAMRDGWQRLKQNGVPLDPTAAVAQAAAELSHVEAEREAACSELLKDYREAQNFVDQSVAVLKGEQPWCRWLDELVDVPLSMLENLPQVAEFLVANHLYRWNSPGVASADKTIEKYNASNGRVLTKLLSGGTDDMLDLMAAHLQVAEACTEDADVEIWVWNHGKAKLSLEQAEASRARKDVDPLIKEVILFKWQETLTENHGMEGLCLPRFLFEEAAAVSLAKAKTSQDFGSLVLQEFLDEEEVKKRLPCILLKELQAIGQKDSVAAARFCLAIHESLMTAPERDRELFSHVVVETTSSRDEVAEVQFEIGGETIPFKKEGNAPRCESRWSVSRPRAFCVSFNEPQELTALRLVVDAKDPATSNAKDPEVRILGSLDGNEWTELASKGECGAWLKLRPGKSSKVRKDLETWKVSVKHPEIGGGPALLQTALAGGKDALQPVISLLKSCSSSAQAATAIASQPWDWTAWMGALSCLEIEHLAKGLSEEERKRLLAALKSHPPAVAAELFLGYKRDMQELGDGKGDFPSRIWAQLTAALERLQNSEMIVETFREEHCRNCPNTLQAMVLEERLRRYANAHPQVGTDDLENVRNFSKILQSRFGGLGVVNCLDLMEQQPDEGNQDPVRSDAEFLALVWKWRMEVDQVFARLCGVERADWRAALAAMRLGGARTAEELADLMKIAASCDADKNTIQEALKLVQDSRTVQINSMPVSMLQEKDIEEWSRTARDNGKDWVLNHMPEVMALVGQASKMALHWQPYDSQLLPLALLMKGQRLALQCLTGEGKQLLLALFSAFRALLFKDGYLTVLTSNENLASREPDELKAFYELLGLRVGHNVNQEVQVRKQTYQDSDVVYAHLSFLLTDYLETEFFHRAVLPEAQHTWKETCLLDECDKLCIDEAGNTLYLAQDIADLEHCESTLVNTFAAGQCVSSEEILKEVEAELKKSLQNGSIPCPNSINEFAVRRLPRWLHSVLLARQMQEGGSFILRNPKGDEAAGPQPITMDLPSGQEQWSVRLSDGLQQFLSLEHDCYLDAESLRAVFMSPVTFFKKVKEFFGVTGTLGGDHDRDFLTGLFDVGVFDVPPRFPKRVEELDPVVAVSAGQWVEKVSEEAMASLQRGQACLVLCQTNGEANTVYEACKKSGKGRVLLCAEEAHQQVRVLLPGDIMVATNKCARGENIKVDSGTKGPELQGTLHVICAYWPGVREQDQIYGRTCRNGEFGSVQLVLLVPEAAKEDRYLKPFLVLQLLMQGRLEQTAEELWHLESVTLAQVDCAASLFDRFRQKMQEMWDKLKLKDRGDIVWKCVQNVLCADFAFWLDRKDEDLEKISRSNLQAEEKKLKSQLEQEVMATWTGTADDLVQRSCAQSVRLAVSYLKDQGKAKEARLLLEKAIQKEEGSGFGYAQHLFMGAAILKLDGSKKSWPEARKHFDEAHVLFMKRQLEQAALAQVQSAVNGCAGRPCNGRYLQQTGEKAQLLAPHVSSTGKVCGADVGPDMFLMDVGTDDGMLWRSKQLYNALKKKNVIVEDIVRALAGKEPELKWLHPSFADKVRNALKQKRSDEGRFTLEDCQSYAGSSSKVWKYLLDHGYLGQENSSAFVVSDELSSEQKKGLTEVDGGFIVDWDSTKAEEIQKALRKKDVDELDETKSAKCLDAFTSLLKDPLQKVWQGIMKGSKNDGDDKPGHRAAVMALRRALQETPQDTSKDAKPLPDTALFKDNILTECASFASATPEAVAEILITILSSESQVVVLQNLPDPGRILHVRLHEEGVLLPPRINPKADLEAAVKEIKGVEHGSEAGKWLKEAFLGEDAKNPILQRMEDAKGLFDTADSGAKIQVSFCHILDEMHEVPRDARGLEAAGLIHVLQFEEVKNISWSWGAFWVGIIGLAQVALGALLIYVGWAQVGLALMSEGIGDIAFAINAGLTGSFSWRAYAMHKVVSVAISLATFCLGAIFSKIFKLGGAATKEMTKKGVAMLAGKMLVEGAVFAAADVCIDKLLEEGRKKVVAESTDALRKEAHMKLKGLKKVLSQVFLHFPDTAMHHIAMIGKDALACFAFEIAQRATSWAENIGSQLASNAKENSKPAMYWKAVNIFLTAASFLTSLAALIVVLANFAGTVKSKLENLVKGKDEMKTNEEIEQKVASAQETLGQLVVDKASSEVTSGMYGPAVKLAFHKATRYVAKNACKKVVNIQEKLQAKSKEVLPKAVEPMMVVKPKADKQKPSKKAKKLRPAMMPPSPEKEEFPTPEQGEKDRRAALQNNVNFVRNKVSQLNSKKGLMALFKGEKIQFAVSQNPLEPPKDSIFGPKVELVPRTNTKGSVVKYGKTIFKDSQLLNEKKCDVLKGVCQEHAGNAKDMVALHAMGPEFAKKAACIGAPTLAYSKELAEGQMYKEHYRSFLIKLIENQKSLNTRHAKLLTELNTLKDKRKLGNGLTDREKVQLSQYNKQLMDLDKKRRKLLNLQKETKKIDSENRCRFDLKLNYQKVGSQQVKGFSAQNGADTAQQFLDLCGKVLGRAQEEMKKQSGKKDPIFANYTVRGNFRGEDFVVDGKKEKNKTWRHAITFYILTHQDKKGRPFQTVHLRDCNVGDLFARAKNWSDWKNLSQTMLSSLYDARDNDGKVKKAIKFDEWSTERYEHSKVKISSPAPKNLVSRFADLGLPHNVSQEVKVMMRYNEFPQSRRP